ncbi:MAG TPA: hypothetical protein PKY82_14835 [Pyrinomonadaceae bacterium]|nr:hypothetical protein [Pyrinomonadaceae bacterium]
MKEKRIDFSIQEAGCLLYIADKKLDGFPFGELTEFFGGRDGLKDLTLKGAIMSMELYQDDGYSVRFVIGDLTDAEKSEWTSKISWKLNLESGEMVVSGVCDEDLEDYMEDFGICENDGNYELGCFVQVPKGIYQVDVYGYPPGDLAGGWMRIEDKRLFHQCFGKETDLPFEKPIDYFKRTRPNENPPKWIVDGWEDKPFLNFLIHLSPLEVEPQIPEFEADGCLSWTFRKPPICPIGIQLEEG